MAQIMPVQTRIPNKTTLAPARRLLPVFKHNAVKLVRRGVAVTLAPAPRLVPVFKHNAVKMVQRGVAVVVKASAAAVTLEKPKLDTTTRKQPVSPLLVSNDGNDGRNGNNNNHSCGSGSGDDGDDDNYFDKSNDGEDGEEGGLFRRRMFLGELFERKVVDAVLNEWQKTVLNLPAGLRQAYEMCLISSAQMARFLAINARPTTERYIIRRLPEGVSRAYIGRVIADPAFLYKLLLEQAATIGCSVWWEVKNRKHRLKQEWDLALLNVLTVSVCNTILIWSLAPCRSYGNTFQYDLQNTLQKLPNNIFEKSYPLREFDMQKRIQSLICKAAELYTVGLTAGAVQGALSCFLAGRKEGRLSLTVPSVGTNALGYGAFLGLYANLRYQMLCGIDRSLIYHLDVIGVALFFSTALRVMNVQLGEISKLAWLDVEVEPLVDSDDLLRAYIRPTETDSTSSTNPFISGTAVLKRLGLLGIEKQGDDKMAADGEAPTPKPRRKRVVRKVTLRSA